MPNPPCLDDCRFCGHIPQSTRFRTIHVRGVTGLTFFFSFSRVYAIHAHTPTMPHAKRTFESLSKRRQADMAWVYLPIPKGEAIIAFGVRLRRLEGRLKAQKPCFLVIALIIIAYIEFLTKSHRSVQNWLVISLLVPLTRENIETSSLVNCIQGFLYIIRLILVRPPFLGHIPRTDVTTVHSYHSVTLGPRTPPSSTQIFRQPR